MKLRVLCLCFWVSALRRDLRTQNGSETSTLADLKGSVADISTCGVWNHNVTWCQETARRPRLLTNKAEPLSCCVWTGKKNKTEDSWEQRFIVCWSGFSLCSCCCLNESVELYIYIRLLLETVKCPYLTHRMIVCLKQWWFSRRMDVFSYMFTLMFFFSSPTHLHWSPAPRGGRYGWKPSLSFLRR